MARVLTTINVFGKPLVVLVDGNRLLFRVENGEGEVEEPPVTTIANVSAAIIIPSEGTAPNEVPYPASFTLTPAVWSWTDANGDPQTSESESVTIEREWLLDGVSVSTTATLGAGDDTREGKTLRYRERAQDPVTGEWSDWAYAADITPIRGLDTTPIPPVSLTILDSDWGMLAGKYVDPTTREVITVPNPGATDPWVPYFWIKYGSSGYGEYDPAGAPLAAVEWASGSTIPAPEANWEPAPLVETLPDGRSIYRLSLRDLTGQAWDLVPRPNGATSVDITIRAKFEDTQAWPAETSPRKTSIQPIAPVKPDAIVGWTVTAGTLDGQITIASPAGQPVSWGDDTAGKYQWHNTVSGWQDLPGTFPGTSLTTILPTALHGQTVTIQIRAVGALGIEGVESSKTVDVPGAVASDPPYWETYNHIGSDVPQVVDKRGRAGYRFQFWIGGDVCPHDRNWVVQIMDVHSVRITGNAKATDPFYHVPECKGLTARHGVAAKWDPEIAGRFLVAVSHHSANEPGGLFETTDYGQNFRQVAGYGSQFGANQFTLVGGQANWGSPRTLRSWHRTFAVKKTNAAHWLYVNQAYGNTGGDVMLSTDRGNSWVRQPYEYIKNNQLSRIFCADSDAGGRWYFCSPNGIHYSDNGSSWTLTRANLPNGWVLGLQCHPTNQNIAYVAVLDQGVYRTTDRFQSFTRITPAGDANGICNVFAAEYDFNRVAYMTYNKPASGSGETNSFPKISKNGLAASPSWTRPTTTTDSYGWRKGNTNMNAPGDVGREYQAAFMWIEGDHILHTSNAQWQASDNAQTFHASEDGIDNLGSGDQNHSPILCDPNDPEHFGFCGFDTGMIQTQNMGDSGRKAGHGKPSMPGFPGSGMGSISPTHGGNRCVVTVGGYKFYSARITHNFRANSISWSDINQIRTDNLETPGPNETRPVCNFIHYSSDGSTIYSQHYICTNATAALSDLSWTNARNAPGFPGGGYYAGICGVSYTRPGRAYAINHAGNQISVTPDYGQSWSVYCNLGTGIHVGDGKPYSFCVDPLDDTKVWWWHAGVGLKCFDGNTTRTIATDFRNLGFVARVLCSYNYPDLVYFQGQRTGQGAMVRVENALSNNPKYTVLDKYYPTSGAVRGMGLHWQSDVVFQFGTVGTKYFPPPTINATARTFLDRIKARQAGMDTTWRRNTYGY